MPDVTIRFTALLTYIENNLDSDLNTDTLCKVVHLSKFHFHRQFKAAWGISLHTVIKLLKMKRAAYLLAFRSDHDILTIALLSGFNSHEAFTRSFRKIFGINPSAFRLAPDWTSWHKQYEPVIQLRNAVMSSERTYQVNIVNFPTVPLLALEHTGLPNTLGNTIKKFVQWRKENSLTPAKERTFNLLYNDPSDVNPSDFRFDVCCSYNGEVPPSMYNIVKKKIPEGKCAMIRHVGSDDTIAQKVNYLYSTWTKESGAVLRNFPLFFERISFFPEVPENEMITDIYLPIE